MATQYFRITGYHPTENFCFIVDSHGMFDKMWQFSSFLVKKGIKVIEVSNDEQFIDIDLKKVDFNSSELILRATGKGHPDFTEKVILNDNEKEILVRYIKNESIVKIAEETAQSASTVSRTIAQLKEKYKKYKELEVAKLLLLR